MKINKKAVSHFLGLAVLFGVIEVTHQLTINLAVKYS